MSVKFKYFVVSCIDSGDSCDGKPRVLFISENEDEAKAYIRNDMEGYVDEATDDNGHCSYSVVDFDLMRVSNDDYNGCEWQIEEIEVELPSVVKEYLKELVNLLKCDYNGIMELLPTDQKRIDYVRKIEEIGKCCC